MAGFSASTCEGLSGPGDTDEARFAPAGRACKARRQPGLLVELAHHALELPGALDPRGPGGGVPQDDLDRRRPALRHRLISILGTVVVAWATTRWWWLNQPLSPELRALRAELVLQAADAMQAGATMEEVEAELGIDLRPDDGPPGGPPTGLPPRTGLFVRSAASAWLASPTRCARR